MAYRNYSETDLSFYSEKEIEDVIVDYTPKGKVISWKPVPAMAGYAIYRGSSQGWQLLGTVGENVMSFTDHEYMNSLLDYRVTAMIEGDLFFENDDLKLTKDHESARQDATNRLRTQKEQWRSHPELGANLELLEGEPNTRETARRGIEMITEALSHDNRFFESDFEVRPVPTSVTHVDYYVIIDSDENEPIILKQPLEM